jgi:CheY-like chemotaxis protein
VPHLLVVEDEPEIRKLIVLHLERDGFECRTAANGADALSVGNIKAHSRNPRSPPGGVGTRQQVALAARPQDSDR